MPLLLRCDELEPGMTLLDPFVWKGRVMLSCSHPLTCEEIRQLRLRYAEQKVRIRTPELDQLAEFDDDSSERQTADGIRSDISDCFQLICRRWKERGRLMAADFQHVEDVVHNLTDFFKGYPAVSQLVNDVASVEDYLAERTGNVFLYSMMLGSSCLDYVARERRRQSHARDVSTATYEDLNSLGLGAVLMDVAMIPLQNVYLSDEPLSQETLLKIQKHPAAGVDMLPLNMPATARAIVRTHHENMDGSGYPDGSTGDHHHVFTRIVRVVDSFEAATAGRVYSDARSPARVLWEMTQGQFSGLYDPVLTCGLVRLIQPFPIGSRMKMLSGYSAVVTRYNHQDPLAPYVVIAFDEEGQLLPGDRIVGPVTLASNVESLVASYEGEDMTFLNQPRKSMQSEMEQLESDCEKSISGTPR